MFKFIGSGSCVVLALQVFLISSASTGAAEGTEAHRYALLIGVNTYDDVKAIKRDQNLSFAENDAQEMADTICAAGFAAADVVAMTTARSRNDTRFPTAAKIRKQVKAIADRLRDGDSVVVCFAGYEMQFANDDDYYLCPADADADDIHTLVSLREICTVLGQAKGAGKLVIIDSCRSMEGRGQGKAPTPRISPGSVGVLFACSTGQSAYEVPEKRHGVLTSFVVDGLRGAADDDRDRTVTAAELVSFVKARVSKHQKDQQPELIGSMPQIEFPLSR
jgi:uncharacterized caspase-like protein